MPNLTRTDIDVGSVVMREGMFEDELVTFAGTATYAKGTILARNTSTLKLQLYVKGGVSNGNGVPVAVLTYAIDRTGAGDVKARVCKRGVVDFNRLVINADGSNVNIDATVKDLLKDQGLYVEPVQQLAGYDQ
jgi:head decoration protein D